MENDTSISQSLSSLLAVSAGAASTSILGRNTAGPSQTAVTTLVSVSEMDVVTGGVRV